MIHVENSEVVLTNVAIENGVDTIAGMIHSRVPDDTTVGVIGIMSGGLPFMVDLSRKLLNKYGNNTVNELMYISLYGKSRKINVNEIQRDIQKDNTVFSYLKNIDTFNLDNIVKYSKAIVIVDDICDSGATIFIARKIVEKLLNEFYNVEIPIYTATVINVTDSDIKLIEPDFSIHNGTVKDWYFGYGMDLDGKYRMLNCIYKVNR